MTRGRKRRINQIEYDEELDLTNIDKKGGQSFETHQDRARYASLGAPPTKYTDYGSHSGTGENGRYSGRGRKNDFRCWKNYTRGKQFEREK